MRFAVIGLEHAHVYSMTLALMGAGAELAAFHSEDEAAARGFSGVFDGARRVREVEAVLEDVDIELVVLAGVPSGRGPMAVRAMVHGKDVLADKPAVTTLDQLDAVVDAQARTGRFFSVWFSERHESRATVRAVELVRAGAIGEVAQVVGFGPHRLGLATRPGWFLEPARNGGILCDLASHQIDQVLAITGATTAEVVSASVANLAHPEHPTLEDYGDVVLRTERAGAMCRVDWYTPDGLSTWGDGRLFVQGTQGQIEVRKNCDVAGRPGGDHLLIVDGDGERHEDRSSDELPFAGQLLDDIRNRTETAMGQAHTFEVCRLAVAAQRAAVRRGHLAPTS